MKRTAKKASAKKSSKAAPSKKVSPAKTPAPKAAPKVSPVTEGTAKWGNLLDQYISGKMSLAEIREAAGVKTGWKSGRSHLVKAAGGEEGFKKAQAERNALLVTQGRHPFVKRTVRSA
jgi:hypothetical protein